MSTSLARRVRRIGLLPQVSLSSVLDENLRKKLSNRHDAAQNAQERVIAAQDRIEFVNARDSGASEVEKTAAKNALSEARAAKYTADKDLDELTKELGRKFGHQTRPRLLLTDEELAAQAASITLTARAKRKGTTAEIEAALVAKAA